MNPKAAHTRTTLRLLVIDIDGLLTCWTDERISAFPWPAIEKDCAMRHKVWEIRQNLADFIVILSD